MIAAAPVTDTVKRAGEPCRRRRVAVRDVVETTAASLWAAQTPQVFRAEALREALDGDDPERLAAATDEAMLVEAARAARS